MEFDWDGVGGLPFRSDVGDTVAVVYEASFGDDMPEPFMSMNGDGTIDIEYDGDNGRKLFLTFKCEGVVTYIKVFEDDQTTVEGTIRFDFHAISGKIEEEDLEEIKALFGWLTSES